MSAQQHAIKRTTLKWIWRFTNPLARPLAGLAPWWVQLEMVGSRTGRVRRIPLAAGPRETDGMWVIALHGRQSAWVRNVEAHPVVRLKHRLRWRTVTASVEEFGRIPLDRFNAYARSAQALTGIDPVLVRFTYQPT
ncbi:hypothetical protein GCM10027589_16460 [Actinocorallia lasiicapitis]